MQHQLGGLGLARAGFAANDDGLIDVLVHELLQRVLGLGKRVRWQRSVALVAVPAQIGVAHEGSGFELPTRGGERGGRSPLDHLLAVQRKPLERVHCDENWAAVRVDAVEPEARLDVVQN